MIDTHPTFGASDGNDDALRSLLGLGHITDYSPVAELRRRLSAADGLSWFDRILLEDCQGHSVDPQALLLSDDVELDILDKHYRHAKQFYFSGNAEDGKMRGLAWYLMTMAAAAAHHDAKLSSQPTAVLVEALLELAPDLPEPWGTLAAEGALALDA